MVIAHVSLTPLEGAAWAAAEAFREAGFDSFCIAPENYPDGGTVPTDYHMPPVGGAVARLDGADAVVCHEVWPVDEPWYPRRKPTVVWTHRPRGDEACPSNGWPWGMSGGLLPMRQTQTRPLPELVPLRHRFYQVGEKPAERIRIAYCPADRADARRDGPAGETVPAALADLNAEVDLVVGRSLADKLRRMAAAHIVVDGSVDGSYGRTSLEALALGCVVVNNCDSLRTWNIQRMTGGSGHPFNVAEPIQLHETLVDLIRLGPAALQHMGRRNRQWLASAWHPAELIRRNIQPLIDTARSRWRRLIGRRGHSLPTR